MPTWSSSAPVSNSTCALPSNASWVPRFAERVGDWGGFDAEGEWRGFWKATGHPRLWYAGGTIAQSRFYSRFIKFQINAALVGMLLEPYLKYFPAGKGDGLDENEHGRANP